MTQSVLPAPVAMVLGMPTRNNDPFVPRITSMRFEPRPRFKCIREFILAPTDAERFGSELRKEYPTIRFLACDYQDHWIEREFAEYEEPGSGKKRREVISESTRPPHGDPMPYVQSPGDIDHDRTLAWVEPPGWTPQWSAKPYRRGRYVLRNEPRRQFIFLNSGYVLRGPKSSWKVLPNPPTNLEEQEMCHLFGGYLHGPYLPGDVEQQEFLKRVWRIARKVTTDKLALVDLKTLEFRFKPKKSPALRVGLDAAEWTRRDRRHLIGCEIAYRAADAFRGNGGT